MLSFLGFFPHMFYTLPQLGAFGAILCALLAAYTRLVIAPGLERWAA